MVLARTLARALEPRGSFLGAADQRRFEPREWPLDSILALELRNTFLRNFSRFQGSLPQIRGSRSREPQTDCVTGVSSARGMETGECFGLGDGLLLVAG